MPKQYSSPPKPVSPSDKQRKQRKLSWALRILMGAEASIKHFVPGDIGNKHMLLRYLDIVIDNIRWELRNIK
jgi:hypothetical protein